MLHSSIGILLVLGIGIARGKCYRILGALLGIVLTIVHSQLNNNIATTTGTHSIHGITLLNKT